MRRVTHTLTLLVLAFVLMATQGTQSHAKRGRLVVTGPVIKTARWVRGIVGRPPVALRSRLGWARLSSRMVETAYKQAGFDYCRVFYKVDDKGRVLMHVDEGRMDRVELVGSTDIVKHVLFPLDVSLPERIFQRRVVDAAVGRFRVRHKLGPMEYRVRVGATYDNPLGQTVRERYLQVRVSRPPARALEDDQDEVGGPGFGFKLITDLRFGANAIGTAGFRNLLLKGDSFLGRLEVGVPLWDMMFDESGKLRWRNGRLQLRYNFPFIGDTGLYPMLVVDSALYYDGRKDVGFRRVLTLTLNATFGMVWQIDRYVTLAFLGRYAFLKHMRVETVDGWPADKPTSQTDGTSWGVAMMPLTIAEPDFRRRDLRSRMVFTPLIKSDGERLTGSLHFVGQKTFTLGAEDYKHYLILRSQAWATFGDIMFWDERPLSGTYHRVYMSPFIWAREAAQVELAWRFPVLGEEFMLGVFNDFSVYGDRVGVPFVRPRPGWANAVGPSAHALLFNFLAIDLFYGFGFSRFGEFTHTLTFTVRNVF